MKNEFRTTQPQQVTSEGTYTSYIMGFLISIILTLAAYVLVVEHLLTRWVLVYTILGLGGIQAWIQLRFFLHLGQETKPRWGLMIFLFMVTVLAIIVWGSLWIMYNLDDRTMPNMTMDHKTG